MKIDEPKTPFVPEEEYRRLCEEDEYNDSDNENK